MSNKKNDKNGKKTKSYRQIKLEQNIWRCDCSDEGKHTAIHYHESGCGYGVWYYLEDMHLGDEDEN